MLIEVLLQQREEDAQYNERMADLKVKHAEEEAVLLRAAAQKKRHIFPLPANATASSKDLPKGGSRSLDTASAPNCNQLSVSVWSQRL